jgi:hypothetical protein
MAEATPSDQAEFRHALGRMRAATGRFIAGDAPAWKAMCSQGDGATIVGGWGGHERGWAAVSARYDWASARYRGGEVRIEIVAQGVGGDFGYTYHVEHLVARLVGVEPPVPIVLRVTHLYRRENGAWKLLHRHADALTAIQPTEAVIRR